MPDRLHGLETRIESGEARLAVIGMGYVGLPLMLTATAAGYRVLGFDIDPERVAQLNAGRSPLAHIDAERIRSAREAGLFEATAEEERLSGADVLIICVPTPLGPHREPDLGFVENTARTIARNLRRGQLVILESTTYPGTSRDIVRPILETSGLRSGTDFLLAYSPEREDPGNRTFDTARIPKVVGGDGERARDLACALYGRFVCRVVPVSSTDTAEAVKLTENIFRAVNIALVNELKMVFQTMGIDIFEVIEAASTKPFGFMPFWPGPGLGGHCIPIDPFYLTWRAREFGIPTRFIELAGEVNAAMPAYVVERLALEMDRRFARGLRGARILLLGIAYKKNIDDMRESPALVLWDLLSSRGAEVSYHDPHVERIPRSRRHGHLAGRCSVPLEPSLLAGVDAVVLVTDHDAVDYRMVVEHAPLILDTRGRLRGFSDPRIARA